MPLTSTTPPYELRLHDAASQVDATAWDALLALQSQPTPFMRHAYLAALETSGSATARTGWVPRYFTLWQGERLCAACALYIKAHSYGEYVFDWGWADAPGRKAAVTPTAEVDFSAP